MFSFIFPTSDETIWPKYSDFVYKFSRIWHKKRHFSKRFFYRTLSVENGAKECIVWISARAFQRVFTCKNRRRYSRERAPRSLGEVIQYYSIVSLPPTYAAFWFLISKSGRLIWIHDVGPNGHDVSNYINRQIPGFVVLWCCHISNNILFFIGVQRLSFTECWWQNIRRELSAFWLRNLTYYHLPRTYHPSSYLEA